MAKCFTICDLASSDSSGDDHWWNGDDWGIDHLDPNFSSVLLLALRINSRPLDYLRSVYDYCSASRSIF